MKKILAFCLILALIIPLVPAVSVNAWNMPSGAPPVIDDQKFQFTAFKNGEVLLNKTQGRLPALGFNSWHAYGSNITEARIRNIADAFVSRGLKDAGYEYIVVDDGCYPRDRVDGRLTNNSAFASGFKALGDYIHDLGLKFGMYNSVGTITCAAQAGLYGNEDLDAQSFAEWGVDYLKIDFCAFPWDSGYQSAGGSSLQYVYTPRIRSMKVSGNGMAEITLNAVSDGIPINGPVVSASGNYVERIGTDPGKYPAQLYYNQSIETPYWKELQFNVEVPEDGTYDLVLNYATGNPARYSDDESAAYTSTTSRVGRWVQIALGPEDENEVRIFDGALPQTDFGTTQTYTFTDSPVIKADLKAGVNIVRLMNHRRQETSLYAYAALLDGLNKAGVGDKVNLSLCEWGQARTYEWGYKVGHSWRTSNDITYNVGPGNASWGSGNPLTTVNTMMAQYNKTVVLDEYAGLDRGWNDPDMMVIGMGNVTEVMARSHMALWCMMNSPILLGFDLANDTLWEANKHIVLNNDVIALNQDPLGIQCKRIYSSVAATGDPSTEYIANTNRIDVLAKPLANGDLALTFINVGSGTNGAKSASVDVADIVKYLGGKMINAEAFKNAACYKVKDLWTKAESINDSGVFSANLPVQESLTIRITPVAPLGFAVSPIPQNVLAGANVEFTAAAAGGFEPYSYQWQSAASAAGPWADIDGETLGTLALDAVTVAMSGTHYRCAVTDSESSIAFSNGARLQVTAGTTRTAAPTASPGNNSTIGINASIWLYSNVAIANGVQIFYTTGATAADTPDPNMGSAKYNDPLCVVAPPEPGTFCVKAIATSTNAAASPVATFSFTVNNSTARLTDIKSDPDFIAWKANHFQGAVPKSVDDKITQVMGAMTQANKTSLLEGTSSLVGLLPASGRIPGAAGGTNAVANLGIPSTSLADGPAGLRITVSNTGTSNATPAERNTTFWPNGSARSSAWNKPLSVEMGAAWGMEHYYFGNDIALAPGQNIHRSVLNGRNFEYYSEDPFLSGSTSAAEVKGFQTKDVGMTIKHYAVNNQETSRTNLPTNVSTRALREIYLRNFEYTVQEAQPWSVMNSYNQINGTSAAQSYGLNTTILRNEWGFKGFVMTDWGMTGSSAGNAGDIYPGFNNGNPIASGHGSRVMSGSDVAEYSGSASDITNALSNANHPLTQAEIDLSVRRVLQYVVKTPVFNDKPLSMGATDESLKAENRALGVEIGTESVILLKNGAVAGGKPALPLDKAAPGQLLSLGLAASSLIAGGTGSGAVNMSTADTNAVPSLNTAIANIIGAGSMINTATLSATGLTTASGERVVTQALWDTWAGEEINAVVYCIKRTSGESSDVNGTSIPTTAGSTGYRLSANEQNLITQGSAFARAQGIPFVVVLNMGTWVRISDWEDKADAIVMAWEQGMGGGVPAARVIFGDANPSGKTPTSVPVDVVGNAANGQKLNPSEGQFGSSSGATYLEGIFVGYRYYDTFDVPVTYPFGYGLSYTTFGYSGAALDKAEFAGADGSLTASVIITNTGAVAGKEVVQFYVGAPGVSMVKPVKELKGYGKTDLLDPGESQTISAAFDAMSLASYDDQTGEWVIEPGQYVVYFGASSKDIRAVKWFTVGSEIVVKTVSKNAMAPRVSFTEIKPAQSIVTFEPGGGAAAFRKAYTTGAAYGILPELPAGYAWCKAGGIAVDESTIAAAGSHTLVPGHAPPKLTQEGGLVKATITYANYDGGAPVSARLILALYDGAGKMLAMTEAGTASAIEAGSLASLEVSLAVSGAAVARGFLWDGAYVPLTDSAMLELK